MEILEKLLGIAGVGGRVKLEWVSAAEGVRFGEVITTFHEEIVALGPSPLSGKSPDPDLLEKIEVIERIMENFTIKVLVGRKRKIIEDGNVYGDKIAENDYNKNLDEALNKEFIRQWILLFLEKEPLAVKDISKKLVIPSKDAFNQVNILKARGLVELDKIDGITPIYRKVKA
jgi:hypothetical protein